MASEILGLFTTPDQYNMMQQQALDARALQYAQLNPFQRAEMNLFRGGANLAGGIGSLLGVEDPQLRMIRQRQQLSQGLDISDPNAILQRAQQAAEMGDMQFATVLADYARKAQSELALTQQRLTEKTPEKILASNRLGQLVLAREKAVRDNPALAGTPELAALDAEIASLQRNVRGQVPDTMEVAKELALEAGPEGSDAYMKRYREELKRLTTKSDRAQMFGVDREAKSLELYGMSFGDLDSTQRAKVNAELESDKRKVAAETRPLPGEGKQGAKDIASFRSEVIGTIKPYREAVIAADTAMATITDAIKNDNFVSFDVARRQLIKASGDSQISRKDIEAAGGDPALLGGAIDVISKAFTSTPSIDTQNKIRNTINIMRKLALKKGQEELNVQKNIGRRAKFSQEDMDLIFNFPEFNAAPSKTPAEAPRTNETIPSDVGARVGGGQPPTKAPAKAPAAPKKGQKQTRTLKSGKVLTVEQE